MYDLQPAQHSFRPINKEVFVALTFTTTAEEAVSNGVKVLVHAPAGTGKTMLCATLPRPIIISAESGLLSLSRGNIIQTFGAGREDINYNMDVIKIENINDLNDAYDWATQSEEAANYETIALDSVTEIMEQILGTAKLMHKDPRAAYGELSTQGQTLIRSFRDIAGKNIYMSAKQGPFQDETANVTKYGPWMPGKQMGIAIPYFFDEVMALRIGSDENGSFRYLQTQPDIQYEAKCRSGALFPSEECHMGHLFDKIRAFAQDNPDQYAENMAEQPVFAEA